MIKQADIETIVPGQGPPVSGQRLPKPVRAASDSMQTPPESMQVALDSIQPVSKSVAREQNSPDSAPGLTVQLSEKDYFLQHIDARLLAAATAITDRILNLQLVKSSQPQEIVRDIIPEGDHDARMLIWKLAQEFYRLSAEYRQMMETARNVRNSMFAKKITLSHVARALNTVESMQKRLFTLTHADNERGLAFAVEKIKRESPEFRFKLFELAGNGYPEKLLYSGIGEEEAPDFLAAKQGKHGLRLEDVHIIAELFAKAKKKTGELPEIHMRNRNDVKAFHDLIEYLYSVLRRLYNEGQ